MLFFVGLHQPSDAKHFERACLSVNRIRSRKMPVGARSWIMDSGAFTEIATYGRYRHGVEHYATQVDRWSEPGAGLAAAVAQDFMCEAWMLERTGLDIATHQRLTIERYDALVRVVRRPELVMPVLQGYDPKHYADHLRQYGRRLRSGMWVGVGSVCKRNAKPGAVAAVLAAVTDCRADLRLHGFGVKTTALLEPAVRGRLYSADSMAWSFAARRHGPGPSGRNDWREAKAFERQINECST